MLVGFHSPRHSAVTLLREAGASMSATMAITGHTSAGLLDVYTHAGASAVRDAVALLPSIMDDEPTAKKATFNVPPEIRAKLEAMTEENWTAIRTELLG